MARGKVWSKEEIEILDRIWASPLAISVNVGLLPGRTAFAIGSKARNMGYPDKPHGRTRDGYTTYKRSAVKKRVGQLMEVIQQNGPSTSTKLVEMMGMSLTSVNYAIKYAHSEKLIYISGYVQNDSYYPARIWAIGNLPDAVSKNVITKMARENNRARKEAEIAAKRAESYKVRRDPLVAALFGAPA